MSATYSVIILAGGKGSRFGTSTPKQFLTLGNQTILEHSVNRFLETYKAIQVVIVLSASHLQQAKKLFEKKQMNEIRFVEGGQTRFHSVKNGLAAVPKQVRVIGVHDAVRPLIDRSVIRAAFEFAEKHTTAVPAILVKDSLRKQTEGKTSAVSRKNMFRVQTPQCFQANILQEAYKAEYKEGFTDDASVVEKAGYKINLVEGSEFNIKITTPPDLKLANYFLSTITKRPLD